jgi:MOSC domain-containing protein YiiM
MAEPHWVKRFTAANRTGTYLRVLQPGEVRAGDQVSVVHRPEHGVSIAEAFRIWMLAPDELARLLEVDDLATEIKDDIRERLSRR